MPRTSRIKWRESDLIKLRNTVEKFNDKVIAISKTDLAQYQPNLKDVDELELIFKNRNRRFFDREIARMERYLKKGAELPYTTKSGANTTIWQKNEVANMIKSINAFRKAELEEYNPSTYTGTMGTIEDNNLRPRKNRLENIREKNFMDYIYSVETQLYNQDRELKAQKYKDNFLTAIKNTVGKDSELYRVINNIDKHELYRFYYTEPLLQISMTSDPVLGDMVEDVMLDRLREIRPDLLE